MNLYRQLRFPRAVWFHVQLRRDALPHNPCVIAEARRARDAQRSMANLFECTAHTVGVDMPTPRGLVYRDVR